MNRTFNPFSIFFFTFFGYPSVRASLDFGSLFPCLYIFLFVAVLLRFFFGCTPPPPTTTLRAVSMSFLFREICNVWLLVHRWRFWPCVVFRTDSDAKYTHSSDCLSVCVCVSLGIRDKATRQASLLCFTVTCRRFQCYCSLRTISFQFVRACFIVPRVQLFALFFPFLLSPALFCLISFCFVSILTILVNTDSSSLQTDLVELDHDPLSFFTLTANQFLFLFFAISRFSNTHTPDCRCFQSMSPFSATLESLRISLSTVCCVQTHTRTFSSLSHTGFERRRALFQKR